MNTVLISNGQLRKSLAATRSLGCRGLKVYTSEVTKYCPSAFSRHSFKHLVNPDPKKSGEAYFKWLVNTIDYYKIDVFFPMDDDTLAISVKYRKQLEKLCALPIPPSNSYFKTFDKSIMSNTIRTIDINVPETYLFNSVDDYNLKKNSLTYPLIIKDNRNSGGRGIHIVNNETELDSIIYKLPSNTAFPLIQKYLGMGDLYDVFFLYNKNGIEVNYFIQKVVRKYPALTGPSSAVESSQNQEILKAARDLMKSIPWYGMINIELLHCHSDNKIYFIELNPRFANTLAFPVKSNIDFPWYLYKIAVGENVESKESYKEGLFYRNIFPSDILSFLTSKNKFQMKPSYFSLKSYILPDDILVNEDKKAFLGFLLSCFRYLFDLKMWKTLLRK